MIPRGEVGLIFASIGLAQGVLDDELYGALLLVVLLTTVVTPPLLRWRIGCVPRGHDVGRRDDDDDREPAGGWVPCATASSCSTADHPSSALVPVALQAAALAGGGRPSDELLSWFGERRDVDVTWTDGDTAALLDVLRRGEPASGPAARRDRRARARRADRRRGRRPAPRRPERARPAAACCGSPPSPASTSCSSTSGDGAWRHGPGDASTPSPRSCSTSLGLDAAPADVRRLLDELAVDDPRRSSTCSPSARLLRAGGRRPRRLRPGRAAASSPPSIGSTATLDGAYLLARRQRTGRRQRDRLDQLHEPRRRPARPPRPARRRRQRRSPTPGGRRRALVDEPAADRPAAGRARQLPAGPRARRARPPGPAGRATARRAARCASPSARQGTPDHWIVDVACRDSRRPARPARPGADGSRLRHRRGHRRHVARRRRRRHVPRPLRRPSHVPGRWPSRWRRRSTPTSRRGAGRAACESAFDNDAAAVAHGVHGHRDGTVPARSPRWPAAFAAGGRRRPQRPRRPPSTAELVDRFALSDRLGRKLDDQRASPASDRGPRRRSSRAARASLCGADAARRARTQQSRNTAGPAAETLDVLNCRTDRPGGDPGLRTSNQGEPMRRKRALKYLLGGLAGASVRDRCSLGGVAFAQDEDPVAARSPGASTCCGW